MHYKLFRTFPDLYPLEATSFPLLVVTTKYLQTYRVPLGLKSLPIGNH